MSSPKVFFVILAVVAILFVVIVLQGDDGGGDSQDPLAAIKEAPDWLRSMGDWFSGWGPRLELSQNRFQVEAKRSSAVVAVPGSDEEVRKATFRLVSGQGAVVIYQTPRIQPRGVCIRPGEPPKPSKSGKLPKLQVMELPRKVEDNRDDPRENSFAIGPGRGELRIDCCGQQTCDVRLK